MYLCMTSKYLDTSVGYCITERRSRSEPRAVQWTFEKWGRIRTLAGCFEEPRAIACVKRFSTDRGVGSSFSQVPQSVSLYGASPNIKQNLFSHQHSAEQSRYYMTSLRTNIWKQLCFLDRSSFKFESYSREFKGTVARLTRWVYWHLLASRYANVTSI